MNLLLKSLVCLKISNDIYCALLFQVDKMDVEILTTIPTVEATAPSTFESCLLLAIMRFKSDNNQTHVISLSSLISASFLDPLFVCQMFIGL